MFSTRLFVRVAVAGATATTVALGGGPAQAQAPTTVAPEGAAIYATSQGPLTFTAGQLTVTCAESTQAINVPWSPDNHSDNGPVTLEAGPIYAESCATNLPGVTAYWPMFMGGWPIAVQSGAPIAATMTIPDGVYIELRGALKCIVNIAPNGPTSLPGTVANGTPPTLTFDHASVPVKTTGSGCPTATTGSLTVTYGWVNSVDPAQQIIVSP
ncbi:hypothetical protein [Nocardia sp. NPDC052566]|uniref:hypothetical protein n=1 Tax=Nocardia sp. NPDC052566 TaxID=3364330 RepID=UPI0037C8A25A